MKMITGEFKARSTTAAESKGTVKQQVYMHRALADSHSPA